MLEIYVTGNECMKTHVSEIYANGKGGIKVYNVLK